MKNCFCKIGLFVVVSIFSWSVYAQSDSLKIDSLKKVLLTEKEDTNKVNTLNYLANSFTAKGNDSDALNMLRRSINLAHTLHFKEGEGNAYSLIGSIYFFEDNYNEAIKNDLIGLNVLQQTNEKKGTAYEYMQLGSAYIQQYKYEEARQNMSKALKIFREINNRYGVAAASTQIGDVERLQENFPAAFKDLYTALQQFDEMNDKGGMATVSQEIGYAYFDEDNFPEAIKSYTESLNLAKQISNEYQLAASYKNIGDVYLKMGAYDTAMDMDLKALSIFKKENLQSWVAWTYSGIGNIYEAKGSSLKQARDQASANDNFLKALDYHLLAFKINKVTGFNLEESYAELGKVYTDLGRNAEAKDMVQQSLDAATKLKIKKSIGDAYLSFSKIDSIEGNYSDAFKHYKMYVLYRDSVINESNTEKAVQANMQYDFDKKAAIAKAAQDKKDEDAKRIKNQQYFAIGALGIVVLAVIIIALIQFRNNKQKQKANNLITKQKQQVETTLTELKSTQAQLIQSEKMASLGELTAGIAHEIQNPLNFVNNFSEVNKELVDELQTELKSGNTAEALAISNDIKDNEEKINHHGKRADAIVRGMLQHSRQTQGVKEPTDINALCDEYLRLSYHGLRAKDKDFNATFTTDFDESIGKINIISQDISRVLLNLYNNGFYSVNEKQKTYKVSQDLIGLEAYKPTVSVTTKKTGNSIAVTVSDNGNGIPQSIVDKIFQPFFTTKPTGQGTGLGLSLSYDIVKAHGGTISVESKEGEGTEFIIQLPENK